MTMTERELRILLNDMSLEEKVGQMVQLPGQNYGSFAAVTGKAEKKEDGQPILDQAGSTLGIYGAEKLKKIQKAYMEKQPHHIPLMFMLDVIHGYETAFQCPLGMGASFDPELVKKCAEIAAKEAAAGGIHVTFSPMADLARDARWGRVMESTGEDPWLNGKMAAAMVEGFQGENRNQTGKVSSCVKHFAAYGAATAGLDYTNVELSEHTLREYYLKAYQEGIHAGCDMVMTSFNTWNGVPSTGNPWLMKEVLRKEMGFDGIVISDWGAVGEMVNHGFCEDRKEAAERALKAGVDIDMCSDCYADYLVDLVREGVIDEKEIDEAVYRILLLKNELGLFENPYKDADEQREKELFLCEGHRRTAREMVQKSAVLLKNEEDGKAGKLLPLNPAEKIAFIGPYIEGEDMRSSWVVTGSAKNSVSICQAAKEAFREDQICFAKGCTLLDNDTLLNGSEYHSDSWEEDNDRLLCEAIQTAKQADVVVLCLGEQNHQSGEATSRTHLTLPKIQRTLLSEISKVNPRIVTVIFSGRPLELSEVETHSKAMLEVWMPGTEGGHGIMDLLTGVCSPSGKLTMSFPYTVGQEPMSYSQFTSGRPCPKGSKAPFLTRYLDCSTAPLYPFGYGLSYTDFSISEPTLDRTEMQAGETIVASVTVANGGKRTGCEVVQLYIQDVAASCVRPVKELKGFRRVELAPGEAQRVTFSISEEMLRFHRGDGSFGSEPGKFRLWIGNSSEDGEAREFFLY